MKEYSIKYRLPNRWTIMFCFFLIVLGMLFLAFNIGLLSNDWRQVFISWQIVFVVVAIILFFHRHIFKGLILFSLGAFFIVPRLAIASPDAFWWVKDDFTHAYSPVFLVIAGVLILLHAVFRRKKQLKKHQQKNQQHETKETANHQQKKSTKHADTDFFEQDIASENVNQSTVFENNTEKSEKTKNQQRKENASRTNFERNSIFRSISEIIHELESDGGTMNALFGNITLDLRNATIPDNICELNANVIFGGITILVPETWNVEVHLNGIFSNIQDSRAHSELEKTHTLIIHGLCIFGNGEIKN